MERSKQQEMMHNCQQEDQETETEAEEEEEEEDDDDDDDCSGSEYHPDETEEDFSVSLPSLPLKKKSTSKSSAKDLNASFEQDPEGMGMEETEFDDKSFEIVQKIIKAGQLEKLKVEQCKVYLRRNGLRLTGNKGTLIHRVSEHQEILDGKGEQMYPVSSFVLNCKGDACTGDVVLFEQNVYEMYSIASRRASGPPCGKRLVAGRIAKESYGAAKQQHTFTIEVLWSKGEKPLPPLHPLLIKGRNLYRLRTLRQKWEDEGERHKVLMEKHSRGTLARSGRESRLHEKEKRKILREMRALKKEELNKNLPQLNPTVNVGIKAQQACSFVDTGKAVPQPQQSGTSFNLGQQVPTLKSQISMLDQQRRQFKHTLMKENHQFSLKETTASQQQFVPLQQSGYSVESRKLALHTRAEKSHREDDGFYYYRDDRLSHLHKHPASWKNGLSKRNCHEQQLKAINCHSSTSFTHRQPLTRINHPHPMAYQRVQLCRYYAQGRCHYGDKCKFLHESREERVSYGQHGQEKWLH